MAEIHASAGGNGHRRRQPHGDAARMASAAWAFTTRRVPRNVAARFVLDGRAPAAGDLVLARVDALGHHAGLQLPSGRRKQLFPRDEIVVAYGNRYAPSQFEAVVPQTLGPCHLVAGGGVAAKALSWHARIEKGPTQITPIGLLCDEGGTIVNLRDHAFDSADRNVAPWPPTLAVVGTSMDSGKTQTAAWLVKGLTSAGLRAGYAKVTGTGAGGDTWLLRDAGADPVIDFTDAGLASTYLASPVEIERVYATLMTQMARAGVDAVVLELADGILQLETAALLDAALFRETVSGIVFTACDSMGAVAGCQWLRDHELPLIGVSGVLSSAPLQMREAEQATSLPVYSRRQLGQARIAMQILETAQTSDQPDLVSKPSS
jgi:hypothetical protein